MREAISIFALGAVLLAGCGGSDDKADEPAGAPEPATEAQDPAAAKQQDTEAQDPAAAKQQDTEAKSNVVNLTSAVEVCFVDNQDYSACQKPEGTGLPLGTGKGQVEVADASAAEYTIIGHSESGNTFTLTRTPDGTTERPCSANGSAEGGCEGGKW